MSGEKKVLHFHGREFIIYAPKDLSKKWFLRWNDGGEWKKRQGPINRENTYKARLLSAEAFAERLAQELAPARTVPHQKIEDYLSDQAKHLKQSSIVNATGIVNIFFGWMNGRPINKANISAFFKWLKQERHPTTYNLYRSWLKRCFDDTGYPLLFINIPRIKTEKTPARRFQPHQAKRLKKYIRENDPQLFLYIQFIYYCFIRPGRELPWIKAQDILLDEQQIILHGGSSRKAKTKNKKTQHVAIPNAFMPALEFVYELSPNAYIFPGHYDHTKPIGRNTMASRHRQILQKLGFGRGFCLYSWKHTGAVAAAKTKGIDIKQLNIQLRHSSLDETDKYLRQMGVEDLDNLKSDFPAL